MLDFIFARWQALKIKYKKFIPFIFIFIFCFSPLSVSAVEVSPDAENHWFLLPFNELGDFEGSFDESQGTYFATGSGSTRYLSFQVGEDNSSILPLLKNGHKYLIYGTVSLSSSNTTASPSSISLYEFINDRTKPYMWSNTYLDKHVDYNRSTYSISGIYSFTMSENIFLNTGGELVWEQTESVAYNGRCSWGFYALDITNTSEDDVNQIITAINNQTDFIVNGDSSTGGIVSGADISKSELESIVSDYQAIENNMLDNFTLYQSDILSDLNGWTWGGLSTCANWVGDTLTSYFQNMGDFKQYIIYPLLLGIALFFIGRGSSIIGHLYRKPTVTTTYTESTSTRYRSGSHSGTNTSTTTYREGGVLRK